MKAIIPTILCATALFLTALTTTHAYAICENDDCTYEESQTSTEVDCSLYPTETLPDRELRYLDQIDSQANVIGTLVSSIEYLIGYALDQYSIGTFYYDPACPLNRCLVKDWKEKAAKKKLLIADKSTKRGKAAHEKGKPKGCPLIRLKGSNIEFSGPGQINAFLNKK